MSINLKQPIIELDGSNVYKDANKEEIVTLKDKILKILWHPEFQQFGQGVIPKIYTLEEIEGYGDLVEKIKATEDTIELDYKEKELIRKKIPVSEEHFWVGRQIKKAIE